MDKTISTSGLLSGPDVSEGAKTVDFEVKYPKNYDGPKHMMEGSVQPVAPDVAEYFESLGIGTILGPTKPVVEKVLTEPAEPFKAKAGVPDLATSTDALTEEATVKATDLIASINEAKTAAEVDALLPEGESRKTVLAAVEAKKKSFG